MGKKAKKIRSDKKKMQKKSLKAANRAKYDAWRNAGTNSKRQKKNSKKKKGMGAKGKHLVSNCGNVGCMKCNPQERPKMKVLDVAQTKKFLKTYIKLKPAKPVKIGGSQKRKIRGKNAA
mgnify:CR=1 FL=1